MSGFLIIAFFVFLILLLIAIKKEWNAFLLFCNIVFFLPALCLTILLLLQMATKGETNPIILFISGLATLGTLIGIFTVLSRSRCPQCSKYFSAKKIGEEQIQAGDIYYKNENNTQVAYQKNLYRRDYVCKRCGHEWSRNISREEKV